MLKHLNLPKILDSLLKYLLAATILAVPLYPKFPFIRVPGTFVSIRLEDFVIAFLGFFLSFALLKNVRKLLKSAMIKAILVYLIIGLVSTICAIYVTHTVGLTIGLLHWIRRVEYLVPFFAGYYLLKKDKSLLGFYINLLSIVIILALGYGLGQKYLSWPIIITQNQEYAKGVALRWIPGSHINSTFAGHYDLASFLVLVLPIFALLFFNRKKVASRLIIGFTFFAGLWLMANAVSRISIFSYLLSVSLALWLVRKYKEILIIAVISLAVFSTTSTVITRFDRIWEVVKNKVQIQTYNLRHDLNFTVYAADPTPPPDPKIEEQMPSSLPEDRSSSIRFNVEWPRAIRALKKNPLLGTGYSSITLATDNDYLRLLGESGILGFLSFVLIFLRLGELILTKLPFRMHYGETQLYYLAGFTASLGGIFINAVFIDIFEASKFAVLFWALAGFAVALLERDNAEISN